MQPFFALAAKASSPAAVLEEFTVPRAEPAEAVERRRRLAAGAKLSEATSATGPAPASSSLCGSSFLTTSAIGVWSNSNSSSRYVIWVAEVVLGTAMFDGAAAAEEVPDIVPMRLCRRQGWNNQEKAGATETKPEQP